MATPRASRRARRVNRARRRATTPPTRPRRADASFDAPPTGLRGA
jgi:hypothetical protein